MVVWPALFLNAQAGLVCVGLPKQQTGLRIDRVLFKQFQQLCELEKLRPGEAVESLIRVAVEAKSITGVSLARVREENTVRMFDDVLFRSRLSRLKISLDLEERFWREIGELPIYQRSANWVEELVELGRKSVSPELVREFEACLSRADKLYEDDEKSGVERKIKEKQQEEEAAEKEAEEEEEESLG